MRYGFRIVSVVFAATLRMSFAAAAEYQVATPTEMAKALSAVRPGDTLVMSDGDWRDADLRFEGDGTPDRPITLRAQTPGKVIVSGRSRLRIAGSHLVVVGLVFQRAHHDGALIEFRRDARTLARQCRLTDCAVVNCNPPDGRTASNWVLLFGEGNRVDHCEIRGKATKGRTMSVRLGDGPNDHRIDHNHFGPRARSFDDDGETLQVGDSKTSMMISRTVVESNLFEECNGEAEIITNKSCENVYRYNTFVRCSGALTLRHGNRCTVEGNVFLGGKARGTGGVRIVGEDHRVFNNYFADLEGDDNRAALSVMNGEPDPPLDGYATVKRAVIAFNTFVECKQTLVIGRTEEGRDNRAPPEDCTVANNLAVGRRGPIVSLLVPPVRFRWVGNLVNSPDPGVRDLAGVRVLDVAMSPPDRDGLRRPDSTGPTVDAAEGDFPFVADDNEGQPRGPRPDVGCDEVAPTAPAPRRPLKLGDVGPRWGTFADR